jgi:uncharacterized protein
VPAPLPPILSVGTAVVAVVDLRTADGQLAHPPGVAGVIVSAPLDPEHAYRVRFSGGDEHTLRRREMQVLSHYQSMGLDPASGRIDSLVEHGLQRCVVYRVITGSRAYGLDHADSDTDRRGIYVPPATMHWSIYGVPEQLENKQTEECYWELDKFVRLALKANPNVLETLYVPDDCVERCEGVAVHLRAERSIFLSRLVFQTFNGYAISQFDKILADLSRGREAKRKHAMHLIRLLRAGTTALQVGELPVRVRDEHRDEMLGIRDGVVPWSEIDILRKRLHREFEAAFSTTRLPERPDFQRANAIVVEARREIAAKEDVR